MPEKEEQLVDSSESRSILVMFSALDSRSSGVGSTPGQIFTFFIVMRFISIFIFLIRIKSPLWTLEHFTGLL